MIAVFIYYYYYYEMMVKKTKNKEISDFNLSTKELVVMVLMMFVISLVVSSFVVESSKSQERNVITKEKLSEFSSNTGMSFCLKSLNSYTFVCKEEHYAVELHNYNQVKLDRLLDSCDDWKIVRSNHCISEHITLYGG